MWGLQHALLAHGISLPWLVVLGYFWLQLTWGLHTGGQHTVNFLHLVWVLCLQNDSSTWLSIVPIVLGGSAGPKLVLIPFVTAFLCLFIFFFLWLNLLLGTQGRSRKLKLFYKQEVRDREGVGVCPWEGSCWVSFWWYFSFVFDTRSKGNRRNNE